MVVARALISQSGFVQYSVDPDQGTIREAPVKITDIARAGRRSERVQQPGPLLPSISVAFRLVGSKRRLTCRRGYDL